MKEVLKLIKKKLKEADVSFFIGKRKGTLVYPYFIGELYEVPGADESGREEYELLMTGFSREDELALYDAVERIKAVFPFVGGYIATMGHQVVNVSYDSMLPNLPDTDASLSKNQVTVKIITWQGGKEDV